MAADSNRFERFTQLCSQLFFATAALPIVLLTAGCSTTPAQIQPATPAPAPVATPALEQFLAEASAQQKKGDRELALTTLEKAARAYPASKEPWLRIAQLHFETANHGAAIVASQEALQRDARDTTARSIIAVSGLRVSATALNDLRQSDSVSASVRSEAEVLARALRETLGESVLVPRVTVPIVVAPPPATNQPSASTVRSVPSAAVAEPRRPPANPLPPAASAAPPAPRPSALPSGETARYGNRQEDEPRRAPASGGSGGSGNPFGVLK